MTSTDISPIPGVPCLIAGDTLVVADLHLGYEIELEMRGLHIPGLSDKIINELHSLIKDNIRTVVILGDVKHTIPEYRYLEKKYIEKLLLPLIDSGLEIHIIRGNHDGWVQRMVPNGTEVHPSTGAVIKGVGYFHGHAMPSQEVLSSPVIISAHIHPAVCLGGERHRCWLKHRGIIIMPAFNRYLSGMCINRNDSRMGVQRKLFAEVWSDMEVYLLNGFHPGRVIDLS